MSSIRLTEEGKKILVGQHNEGVTRYWVGYFGLAYVPKKVGVADESLVGANEEGDYIYNIWQGDMLGTGYAAGGVARATLYDRNLLSNYRYVYDTENGCNRLVAWESAGEVSYVRRGFHVYEGVKTGDGNDVDTVTPGEIPVPAPLFYTDGEYSPGMDEQDFAGDMGPDWPKLDDGWTKKVYPNVSADMRSYDGTLTLTPGQFNTVPEGSGDYIAASELRDGKTVLDQYAKFVSVSKFNKSHGPVSSEGYAVTGPERTHNMSRVTKLFPLAKYEVTASKANATGTTSEGSSVAEAVKYRVELDFTGGLGGALQEYRDVIDYEGDGVYSEASGNSFKFNRIGIYAVPANIRHFYASESQASQGNCRAGYYQVEILPDEPPVLFAVADVEETSMSDDGKFGQQKFGMDFILNLVTPTGDTGVCNNADVYYNLAENEAITWYQNQLLATAGISEAVTNLQVNMAHMMNAEAVAGGTQSGTAVSQVVTADGTPYASKGHSHDGQYVRSQNTPVYEKASYNREPADLTLSAGTIYVFENAGTANPDPLGLKADAMKDGDEALVWLPNDRDVRFADFGTYGQQNPGKPNTVTMPSSNGAPEKGCWSFRRATFVDPGHPEQRFPGFVAAPVGKLAYAYMAWWATQS